MKLSKNVRWVGVEQDLQSRPGEFDALEIILDSRLLPFGYYWVFPKSDHVNVGLIRWATSNGPPLPGMLDDFVASRNDLGRRAVLRRLGGIIPARTTSCFQWENCLVIGDAAGMVNPLTGGGCICGFLSARLAAQTCIQAFRGNSLSVARLRRYRRRVLCTPHFWVIRGLTLLLENVACLESRLRWPVYSMVMETYIRVMHFLLLPMAQPISSWTSKKSA